MASGIDSPNKERMETGFLIAHAACCDHLPKNVAEGAQDEPVFGPATRGDANELAGLEPFLVVASPGIDPPADEETTDQVLGCHTIAQLDQNKVGAGGVGVQSRHQGESLEETA
jgi:hypothetical protein